MGLRTEIVAWFGVAAGVAGVIVSLVALDQTRQHWDASGGLVEVDSVVVERWVGASKTWEAAPATLAEPFDEGAVIYVKVDVESTGRDAALIRETGFQTPLGEKVKSSGVFCPSGSATLDRCVYPIEVPSGHASYVYVGLDQSAYDRIRCAVDEQVPLQVYLELLDRDVIADIPLSAVPGEACSQPEVPSAGR